MSATNRGTTRNENDFYPTPISCIDSITQFINYSKITSFHEPCFGEGVIFNAIPIANKTYCELTLGIDYLEAIVPPVDLIVTNPPFSLALPFLEKSLKEAGTVIYLLRLNFLGSQQRRPFWQANQPTHLFTLAKRPSFTGKGTDATEYAWFVWDRLGVLTVPPGIYVV